MSLVAGTKLGAYEIASPLGTGGMGEVYRARDTRLNRDVAIKVLLPAVAADADRLARFRREAQTLAALNHPNIAHIHGLEDIDGLPALVIELVEGQDLRVRLAAGPIPLDEALPIARQIAEALAAAHGQGIVHRDLKPANVMVRADGAVKVLDFGLAKAVDPLSSSEAAAALALSPTITSPAALTGTGVILGTAAYMSPEQARGKAVDKRSDLWAFGAVLFEMLAGRRAFHGDDVTDTIASVIAKEPEWRRLPATTPPAIRRLLRRCLEKDRGRRLSDAADARLEIDEALAPASGDGQVVVGGPTRRGAWAWLAAGAAIGAAGVVLWWAPWRVAPPAAPLRLSAELGAGVSLANTQWGPSAILSPDGTVAAFVAQKDASDTAQLYVRRLSQPQPIALSGTDDASSPFFSPDGQWIAFFAAGKLKKVPVTGGTAVGLCDAPSGRGGWWGDDGTIVLSPNTGPNVRLLRVSSAGGTAEPLTSFADGEVAHRWPQVLPGAKAVIYTATINPGAFESANIVVQALPTGARKILQRGAYFGRYLPSGHLVYIQRGTLMAAPFDLDRLEVTGPPVPALEAVGSNPVSGSAQLDVSAAGTLAYLPVRRSGAPVYWMTRDGKTTPLRATAANWFELTFAPDGRRVAMHIFEGPTPDVWIYEWERDSLTRLTLDPASDAKPAWTPDGRRIAFASDRAQTATTNLYWQRSDATGDVQRLTESRNPQRQPSWHPSGKVLAFSELSPQTGFDLMILPIEGDEASGWKPGPPRAFLNGPTDEYEPVFSPDGRWLAYVSNESGRQEVSVRPFPGPGGKYQISTGGGTGPRWSRTKPELFFSNGSQITVARYAAEGDTFRAEKPRPWSDARFLESRGFDLHPDGERVAIAPVTQTAVNATQDHVTLIFNFLDELRRIAPAAKK